MLDDFLIRAALAAIAVALAAGPVGCFVVWRRMAYFGDATAHAALLGVAMALAFSVSIYAGVLLVAVAMALGLTALTGRGFAPDTALGVAAHSGLAFGLIAMAMIPGVRGDLHGYLFGDILAVSAQDVAIIWLGALAVLAALAWRWPRLIAATLNAEIAVSRGIDPQREQLVLTLILAGLVAVAIKVVGVLLITAMLILPAAAARPLAATPERMALSAAVIGAGSGIGGLGLSFTADTPAGPSIVAVAAIVFLAVVLLTGKGRPG